MSFLLPGFVSGLVAFAPLPGAFFEAPPIDGGGGLG